MLNFLKHHLTKKEKFLARWSFSHLVLAVLAGILMALGIILWQVHKDAERVVDLKMSAAEIVVSPNKDVPNTGKIGGPFSLTDQNGNPVTDKDFAGKYLLVYFGYTSCPDMCPTGLQSMSRALDMLKTGVDKVQPLFITVDPARDTPKKLKDYDSAFHPRIVGLTGTPEQIASVAKEYQVYYEKGEGTDDYEVAHSSVIYLLSPSGELLGTFDEEVDPKLIVAALQKAWGVQP